MSRISAEKKRARAIAKRRHELQGKPNFHLFRVKMPSSPPGNICLRCLDTWIQSLRAAREAGLLERRAVECPHWGDGRLYRVAFVVRGHVPLWLELTNVDPTKWNELYANLCAHNGAIGITDLLSFERAAQRVQP